MMDLSDQFNVSVTAVQQVGIKPFIKKDIF